MKIIRFALLSAVILFLLVTAMSSLLPGTIRISRAIDIQAGQQQVLARLADIKSWNGWNEYVKAIARPSFVASDSLYAKELSIAIRAVNPASVETIWHQQRNGKTFPGVFNLIHSNGTTTVQWYFVFHFRWYPWEKLSSITYDQQIGPQMEQSLQNLKKLAER